MRKRARNSRELTLALIVAIAVICLYSSAGSSDQLDVLTAKQQAEVVSRWVAD